MCSHSPAASGDPRRGARSQKERGVRWTIGVGAVARPEIEREKLGRGGAPVVAAWSRDATEERVSVLARAWRG